MAKAFICSTTEPIVQTRAGKLRGFCVDGTYAFHGIKYADAARFQAPVDVAPWEGVKDALSYGYVSPMLTPENPMGEILVPHRYWPKSEHCQYLNIWSQSLSPEAKKPVLLWLHGGGFAAGSSIEQVAYDGENMSRLGDVVVVSLNHRLNILGYLDLSPFGQKYANSGNAGNADMVAALRWIRNNIAAFGGDPGNVTLFGQSGGGMKVWTLLQTPSANGLFHKGVVQSGLIDGFSRDVPADGTAIVNALLQELGFPEGDVGRLEEIPYDTLAAAYNKVAPVVAQSGGYIGGNPMANDFYVGDPREVGFTPHARTVPIMVGTVFGEFAFGPGVLNRKTLTEAQSYSHLEEKYGQAAGELLALFKKAYPDKLLSDLLALDSMFRNPSIDFIRKRATHLESPVYAYLFTFEFPYDEGKPAWHCSEIPFVFHNTDKVPVCNLPGVSDTLEENLFQSWISFAKTGNPSHKGLPAWPCSTPEDESTMIFDTVCEVRHNFDHELVALHAKVAPKFMFGKQQVIH